MRALILVVLVGCVERTAPPFDPPPGLQPPAALGCTRGSACASDEVCARDGECLPPDQVRAVHIDWTVSGAAASDTTCSAAPVLRLDLSSSTGGGHLGFAPVPCAEGKFSIDVLPIAFDHVALGSSLGFEQAAIDPATGEATLDLPYGARP